MATIQTTPHSDAVSHTTKHIIVTIFLHFIHSILNVFEYMVLNADLKKEEMCILDAIHEFITHEEVHRYTEASRLLALINHFVWSPVTL